MEVSGFIKKEFLLVISAFLALVSLFLVPFDTVLSYDYNRISETICTLFFFLLIVAGLKECKALDRIALKVLSGHMNTRSICFALILLPFFSAMLFSNDVSLLTFVPLSIAILGLANLKELIPIVVVLQTVAANIGSSLTPFGNPHNLYIFNLNSYYGFTLGEFELKLLPIVIVGTIVFSFIASRIPKKELDVKLDESVRIKDKHKLVAICVLFAIAILTVLDVIPFYITVVIMVIAFVIMMPKVLVKIDYSILFVFFFLFIFANGITNVSEIHEFLSELMKSSPMLTTVFVSQFASNVPATILLEPFTDDWGAIVVGADIGGFGTPIASMASVITLRLYLLDEDSNLKHYLKVFFAINLIMLAALIPTYFLFCD